MGVVKYLSLKIFRDVSVKGVRGLLNTGLKDEDEQENLLREGSEFP